MRRALGLDNSDPARAETSHPAPNTAHTRRRPLVRDGEVPVTVVHHDDHGTTNKLEAARQALKEQIDARERAEQQLAEAQVAIQTLETQLAHERISKDEALSRAEAQCQEVERWLEEERAARQQAEQVRDAAILGRQEAEERLRAMAITQEPQTPSSGPWRTRKPVDAAASDRGSDRRAADPDPVPVEGSATVRERLGRPTKARDVGSEFVEWWKPGWRDRFR